MENVGRLEMCYDGYWGSVCRDYADQRAASVACKELGYNDVVKGNYSHILINTDCCSVRRPYRGSTFACHLCTTDKNLYLF